MTRESLAWLDAPAGGCPRCGAFVDSQDIGALDDQGRITDEGTATSSLAAAAAAGPHGTQVRRNKARPRRPPILRPFSSNAVSGATMPI